MTHEVEASAPDPTRERIRLLGFITLMLVAGFGLRTVAGGPRLPDSLPAPTQIAALLGGARIPVDAVAYGLVSLAWLVWLWVVASLALELLLAAAEGAAHGAAWVRRLRRAARYVTLPLARRVVTAAFAFQVLSRAVPAAAAPLPMAEQVYAVGIDDRADAISLSHGPRSAYLVRSGDTLWTIAEDAYGSGTAYRRLVDANVGRRMSDGDVFRAQGVIKPGWVLDVPEPTTWVESVDGLRWYTVQPGDTLSGIAERVLGERERWSELFELNRDTARLTDGRALDDPDLIWPGLRLRLPDQSVPIVEPTEPLIVAAAFAPPLAADPPPPSVAPELPASSVALPIVEVPPPPLVRDIQPLPLVALDTPESTPDVSTSETETAPSQPPIDPLLDALGLAAAAGLATLGVRRLRRFRPLPKEPENEVVVEGGYAEAQLTHELARHLQGSRSDPSTAIVGQLLQFLDEYNLENVEVIAVRHGRSSTTITLAAGLAEQSLLIDLAPVFATRLQAECETWLSPDQDVNLRLSRLRSTRLPPASDERERRPPWFVPLGVLYDRQVFSVAWPALGHVLVASLPGHGAQTILTSLLATLTARRSPDELRVWLVSRPRTLPPAVTELPHLDTIVDPDADDALAGLVARLRAELEQRALGGAWPELVILVPELTTLGEWATELQLLEGGAAACGVRFVAGSSDPAAAALSPLLSRFTTRMVLHLEAEEHSVALLGVADAAYLGGGGRLLLRIDGRDPVELYGYQVTPEHLERLVRVMRSAYLSGPPSPPEPPHLPADGEPTQPPIPQSLPGTGDEPATATEQPASDVDVHVVPEPLLADGPPIRVICLGAPRVLCAGQQVWPRTGGGDAKPWEFLLYLACQAVDGAPRAQAIQAMWPDDTGDFDPTHRFRQLRYRLRNAFNTVPGAPTVDGVGLERNGALYLDQTIIYSDAQEFLELTRMARIFPGPTSLARLERAHALYGADLLQGADVRRYAWADERDESGVTLREHFRRLFQHATLSLAELYANADNFHAAIEIYRELADLDPGDERVWRALFRLHAHLADGPALMREERRMRAALRELAVHDGDVPLTASSEPSRDTLQEYERLLASLNLLEHVTSAS